MGMRINACIYGEDGVLAGCVTDSVLAQFRNELDGLLRDSIGYDGLGIVFSMLDSAIEKSEENCSAAFLNCLRYFSEGTSTDVPPEMVVSIRRAYRNLLRLCCSNSVRDEVLDATIDAFRNEGFFYIGNIVEFCGGKAYTFDMDGVPVSVKMVEKPDIYGFWDRRRGVKNQALVTCGGVNVLVLQDGDAAMFAEAVRACAADLKDALCQKDGERDDDGDVKELAKALLEVAKSLVKEGSDD